MDIDFCLMYFGDLVFKKKRGDFDTLVSNLFYN